MRVLALVSGRRLHPESVATQQYYKIEFAVNPLQVAVALR